MSSPKQKTVRRQTGTSGRPPTIHLGLVALLGLLLLGCPHAYSMQVDYVEAKTVRIDNFGISPADPLAYNEEWYATSYDIGNIDEVVDYCGRHPDGCKDQDGKRPAMKLCFWHDPAKKAQLCHRIEDAEPGYSYETTRSLKVETLCDKGCVKGSGLVLDAQNKSFTVGWIGSLSCWIYDRRLRDFVNIMPRLRFTEQGEYKLFRNLGSGIRAVAIEAEAMVDWKDEETRYSPHRFLISIYKQDGKGYYREIGSYRTTEKYQSLDDVDEVDVIIPELDKIKRFILSIQRKQNRR